MEKIKVNMTPCEEVKTIHASQGDNATRKWAFDLYDENGKIDSSDIKEQMIFDSTVGGTEQILPENTSDPTTSPIIADIQYPDSLRSEQTFLYRESPTQQDGQAKITKIKGNTLVFNQLVQNGNFVDTSNWTATSGVTFTTSNNKASITVTSRYGRIQQAMSIRQIVGHKYFIRATVNSSKATSYNDISIVWNNGSNEKGINCPALSANVSNSLSNIIEATGTVSNSNLIVYDNRASDWGSFTVENVQINDLTVLGIDNLSLVEVQAWFSQYYNLPYYSYTTGKLLPFVGTELKTTGKNLLNLQKISGTYKGISYSCQREVITLNGTVSGEGAFLTDFSILNQPQFKSGKTYIKSLSPNGNYTGIQTSIRKSNKDSFGFWSNNAENATESTLSGVGYYFRIQINNGVSVNCTIKAQIEENNVATNFEPYTTNTLSLPTLTYFPTGMKSARSAYDEITESKAITRVGSVDLGTLTWEFVSASSWNCFRSTISGKKNGETNVICGNYLTSRIFNTTADKIVFGNSANTLIYIRDNSFNGDYSAFKTAMSGQYLFFELATPTEESITTASLVTEKGETPLYYDDELIADCDETISSESGIFDAKIKLMTDETIYSQKIQLHVEPKF